MLKSQNTEKCNVRRVFVRTGLGRAHHDFNIRGPGFRVVSLKVYLKEP